MSQPQPPVFIVSTGRSGTTTIARTLSLLPGIDSRHEPPPQLIKESSAYRYGELSHEKLKDLLLRTRSIGGPARYCESNQTLALIIPVIAKAFNDSSYVWLVRDGRDVVASTMQKRWYSGRSENHDRYEDCSPIEKAWIDGRVQADRCGEVSADRWQEMSRFAKCCWYWAYVNETIQSDLAALTTANRFTLRLEEIHTRFDDLLAWLQISPAIIPLAAVHNRAKQSPYHWSEWTAQERDTFAHWCGPLMDSLYPEWRDCEEWQDTQVSSAPLGRRLMNLYPPAVRVVNSLLARRQ